MDLDPFGYQPSILPGGDAPSGSPAGEEELAGPPAGSSEIGIDRVASVFGHLKADGPTGLLWRTRARRAAAPCGAISSSLSRTTSQPRSLLSIARLKRARSRVRPSTSSLERID